MKGKYFLGLLSILFIITGFLLLTKKEEDVVVISIPTIYSIHKTTSKEPIHIKLLVNQPESYHFSKELMHSVTIKNDKEFQVMNIKDIHITKNEYIFQEKKWFFIDFELYPKIEVENKEIVMDNCKLEVVLNNNESYEIPIGSFYYKELLSDEELSINNLYATHQSLAGVDTVTGLYLDLYNKSDRNIRIKRIESMGSISFDNFYLTDIEREVAHDEFVSNILLEENFESFGKADYYNQQFLLREKESNDYYVPLKYESDILFAHRFPVYVIYEVDGEEKVFVIDDFPYIHTAPFKPEMAHLYQIQVIYDSRS